MNCFYHNKHEAVANCSVCSVGLCNTCASVYNVPLCRKCAVKQTIKDFFSRVTLPVVLACILLLLFKPLYVNNGEINYFLLWILVGLPFGMKKMFVFLVPDNFNFGGLAIIAVNFVIGGLIGGLVITYRLVRAVFYFFKTIYMTIRITTSTHLYIKIKKEAV